MSDVMHYSTSDLEAKLQRALIGQGVNASARAVLNAVSQVAESMGDQLTEGERDFLLEHTDLSESDLGSDAQEETNLFVFDAQTKALRKAEESAYTTAEVAKLLGREEANVRRSKASGDYFALGRGEGKQSLFPKWQFAEQTVVPGLKEIIPVFPRFYHPLAIEAVMTTPDDDYLGGISPVNWLLTGGSVGAVVELVQDLEFA